MSRWMVSRLATAIAALLVGAAQAPPQGSQVSPSPPAAPAYTPGAVLQESSDPVVADVDGHPITQADVRDAIAALTPTNRSTPFDQLYPLMLERLIQEQALDARARALHVDNDPAVRRHIQAAANNILANEVLNRLTEKSISEEALLARYRAEYQGKQGPEEVDVRIIVLPSEEQARKVIAELAAGGEFAAVAKRDSKDISGLNGGALGFMRQDQLVPEVGTIAFALSPGQTVSYPVRGESGWFVIKIAARRQGPPPSFSQVREELRHQMMEEGILPVIQETLASTVIRRFGQGDASDDAH